MNFKSLVWDNVIKGFETWLFVQAPFLNAWPLRPIVTGLIEKFGDKLYEFLDLVADIEVITLKNQEHYREYARASTALGIIAREKGIESDEYRKARTDAKAALSRFTRFGSAPGV